MELFPSRPKRRLDPRAPLADRMRPQTFEEMLGQGHLTLEGSALRALVEPEDFRDLLGDEAERLLREVAEDLNEAAASVAHLPEASHGRDARYHRARVLHILGEREGAKRWLAFGGFQFQPSEMAKLATLLFLARLVARPRFDPRQLSQLLPVVLVGMIPFVMILLEPDLGTSLSLPAALIPMLYWAGLPLAVLVAIVAPIVVLSLLVNKQLRRGFTSDLGQ